MNLPSVDPAVFQYLFWLYSHPPVYMMSLSMILAGGGFWFWKRNHPSL